MTVPDAPTGLVATRGNETVTLSWSAPTYDGGSQITGYNVYRGTTPGGEGSTPIATSESIIITDTAVTNGITYYYTVRAVNAIGPGIASSEASATPATAPEFPTSLTATGGQGTVHLTWIAPNDRGLSITNYKIYRATSSGDETLLATVGNVAFGTTRFRGPVSTRLALERCQEGAPRTKPSRQPRHLQPSRCQVRRRTCPPRRRTARASSSPGPYLRRTAAAPSPAIAYTGGPRAAARRSSRPSSCGELQGRVDDPGGGLLLHGRRCKQCR